MQAESSQIQMQLFANASAQAGIYMGTLQTIIVLEVPIGEQEQIANYLDKECAKIDTTINDKKEQLETIKEYKKSLIYEYVTGKKRVAC
jgi:type I restriction enzyme S subunit